MNLDTDLATMLSDWDAIEINGETYPGVFNPEEYALPDGTERVPMFLMGYDDWVESGAAIESDVVLPITRLGVMTRTTYQVRSIKRTDDGRSVVLVLAV